MKYKGYETYVRDQGEPSIRSCPDCNAAHEHLRDVGNFLHWCFVCGRYWIFDRYLDSFATDDEMDSFLKDRLPHVEQRSPK